MRSMAGLVGQALAMGLLDRGLGDPLEVVAEYEHPEPPDPTILTHRRMRRPSQRRAQWHTPPRTVDPTLSRQQRRLAERIEAKRGR